MKKKFPCEACHKIGQSCCRVIPMLSNHELAKILIKYGDLIKEKKLEVVVDAKIGDIADIYYIAPEEIIDKKTGVIHAEDVMCPFNENGKCLIYEDRPYICQIYGYKIPCPFEGISNEELLKENEENPEKIKNGHKETKIDLKVLKEIEYYKAQKPIKLHRKQLSKALKELSTDDIILVLAVGIIGEIVRMFPDNPYLEFVKDYKMATFDGEDVRPFEFNYLKAKVPEFANVATIVNKYYDVVNTEPNEVADIVLNKANNILKSVEKYRCEDSEEKPYLSFVAALTLINKFDSKKKSKKWRGKIPDKNVWPALRRISKDLYGVDSVINLPENIMCMIKLGEIMYNNAIKTKL